MSWLSNCSLGSTQNGVFSSEGFSRLYGCNACNPDIFGKAPEREETKHEEINNSTKFENFEKVV